GVINQAHRNYELQQIKQMHNYTITTTLHKANKGPTQEPEVPTNDINQDTDSEDELQVLVNQDSAKRNKHNLEKVLSLWESMLEDEKLNDDWEKDTIDLLY
ncbi:3836_t:CDS:1, partial [Dentiscutata erythropus]